MAFLHTWALALGGLAVGLPLLIHWLTRPKPVRLPLSTIRFVHEAVQQRRARHRLRDALILLARAAAVLLLGLAFARPLAGARPLISAGEDVAAIRVVVLDTSQSMAARERGIERFERARSAAVSYLAYRGGLRANLILAAAQARAVFAQPSSNFAALRDELAPAKVLPQRMDVQAAIRLAAEMLGAGGTKDTRRELVILSDFQRTNWATVDFSPLPQDTLIQLETVAGESPANIGILRVATASRAERGREVRLEVEVGNFSNTARRVGVEVALAASTVRLEDMCPAGARKTLSSEVAVGDAGWQVGQARLVNVEDALAADDVRPLVLEVRPAATTVLVTRQPAEPKPCSSHFLERALSPQMPQPGRAPPQRVIRLDPAQLDRETLAPADLFVLDHPGKLSQEAINLLVSLVQRGRPLLYVAAEPVDATNLRLLSDAAGTALQMPVEFMPPSAGQPREGLSLAGYRREAPPFAGFGDELPRLASELRFAGGLTSRTLDRGLADDVLATYSDRSACLVISACGAGWLAVLNADLARSNLPTSSPLFVPLMAELAERLLGQRRATSDLASGEPLVAYLPADVGPVAGLTIEPPTGGSVDCGELAEEGAGVLWRWNAVGPPGVYSVKRETPVFAIAATLPPEESDLRSLTPEVLKERLAGGRPVHVQSVAGDEQTRDDRWVWLGVGCIGCLLLELVLLKLFRT